MFDILGLGYVAVDDLIYVEAFPPPDAKTPVLRAQRHCGGLTGTALVAAARLGSSCAYAGVLGRDELSVFAKEQMQREGIVLTHLLQCPEAGPVHSFVVVDEQRQTRNVFFDVGKAVGAHEQWPAANVVQSPRVLFVDNCGVAGMIRAARLARAAHIPIVADFEQATEPGFAELLGLVDHLILSQSFAQEITGRADPAAILKLLWTGQRDVVVVTCGAEGCWYVAKDGQVQHQRAFPIKAVDTTGCGDVFHGAYASALARGLGLAESICFASAAAAIKATRSGGQAGIPNRAGVESFLEEQ
jgi:sugar/nucleoside kinase (ribokinase family)